jgi:gliding motility-associated protein GldL
MGLTQLTQGKKFRTFMARLYGWGASIVIIGALFKIQHWPLAGFFLVLGLGTEAIIFFFSAFEPPHEEVDWSLVYPELAGMHEPGYEKGKRKKPDPVAQALDKMLADAKIGPDLIQSLGTGLSRLGENTAKLADLSDASVATNEFSANAKKAASSLSVLNQSYEKAASVMNEINASSDDLKAYNEQIKNAGRNLAAINANYELQLQDSANHLKQTSKFYEGINQLMDNLNSSLEDTKRYKEEVSKLAKNLASLNTVYGNMLSAMNINPNK